MSIVTSLLPRSADATFETLSPGNGPRRVLFVRYEKIGDLLLSCAAICAIAEWEPGIAVDVVAAPDSAPVLRGNPFVRRVHTFDRRAWWTWPALSWRLRREHYDIVVDGRINPERHFGTTPFLLAMTGARIRIGATGDGRERVYTHMVSVDQVAHFAEQSMSVTKAFGIDPGRVDLKPTIYLDPDERARALSRWLSAGTCPDATRVLVNVSVGGPRRHWPDDRYVTVLRHVRARFPEATLLVIGLPQEEKRIKAIVSASGTTYAPTSDIREAAALVATSDIAFTPDTAISHIAGVFGVPVVVMMTSMTEARMVYSANAFKPIGCPVTVVRGPTPWLVDLPAEPACEALTVALEGIAHSTRGPREARPV